MKRVLVIIVTYNGMRWLDRCLSSVCTGGKSAQNPSVDVFVVDNDSTDGSADWIEAHFQGVKLVRSAENLGFTKANNLGFEWAVSHGYDYVYLLNQDAWLEPGAMETLVSAAEAHPEYAVLSPLQMTDGYKAFDSQFARIFKPDTKCGVSVSKEQKNGPAGTEYSVSVSEPKEVRRVMAAHWLLRVEALKEIGQFSGIFPFYGQDDDWCNRARYHGWRIGIVPEARAVHDRAQRKEAKERIIDRNYRVGSLVGLCDINRPLWERFLFVCAFTFVKSVKYLSFAPFRHFAGICSRMKEIKSARMAARKGGMKFV